MLTSGWLNDSPTLSRYTSAGTLDAGFATGGRLDLGLAPPFIFDPNDLTVSGGSYYLAAGYSEDNFTTITSVVTRVDSTGTIDGAFGNGGRATVAGACNDVAGSVAVLGASIYLVAAPAAAGCGSVVLRRFTLSGAPDTTFGSAGVLSVGGFTASGQDYAIVFVLQTALVQPNGMFVLFGRIGPSENPFPTSAAAFRVLSALPPAGSFVPLSPSRILDTRHAIGVATTTPVAGQSSIQVQVTGVGGVPATGVGAVVLNVTVTQPTWEGFVTAYPTGEPRPVVSNVNFSAGQTVPNLVTVKVGAGGQVTLFNGQFEAARTLHLVADVAGYYLAGTASEPGTYAPLVPSRILDTRNAIGVATTTPVPGQGSVELQVTGAGGVPATGVAAVVLNVTVTQPTWDGFITVYPTGQPRPGVSNLNFTTGTTIPNLVTVKAGDGGKVTLFNGQFEAAKTRASDRGCRRVLPGGDGESARHVRPGVAGPDPRHPARHRGSDDYGRAGSGCGGGAGDRSRRCAPVRRGRGGHECDRHPADLGGFRHGVPVR